jgi:hypothetical protein
LPKFSLFKSRTKTALMKTVDWLLWIFTLHAEDSWSSFISSIF